MVPGAWIDSTVVSDGLVPAVAEGLGTGWTASAPEAGASAVGAAVVVCVAAAVCVAAGVTGAVGVAVAVAVATEAGVSSACAGAMPVVGTDAKARTSAANNAVFIRKEFTFFFHETAVRPTGQLDGRKRPE